MSFTLSRLDIGRISTFASPTGLALVLLASSSLAPACSGSASPSHDHPHADDDPAHGSEHSHAAEHAHPPTDHEHAPTVAPAEEHGHEHADTSIAITRFSDKLELFAEHPPAVAGEPLVFLAHLTVLHGFRALEQATVTLELDGPEHVSGSVGEGVRPGIFRVSLPAPAAGRYRARVSVDTSTLHDVIDGFEVQVFASTHEADHAAGPEPAADSISFLKEQQWQIPFATAFARQETLVPTLEVAGHVTTPPGGDAVIGAGVFGRVVAPRQGFVQPGQSVRRGDLLATIAPAPAAPEDAARADLAVVEANARVQAAVAAVDRAQRLIAERAISQRELDEARREHEVAKQALNAAQKANQLFRGAATGRGAGTYRVVAPIDGVVTSVQATPGQSVASNDPLFHLVDLTELWIAARVPEQQAAQIATDQPAAYQLPGVSEWLPIAIDGRDSPAYVVHVSRVVDPRSRTVEVVYGLRQADPRLRVGGFVRVAVPVGEPWEGVVVPRDAVLDDDGRRVVYVQTEGETFELRVVRTGPTAGGRMGIESGIQLGERVVTRGANVIRLSEKTAGAPAHGHVH